MVPMATMVIIAELFFSGTSVCVEWDKCPRELQKGDSSKKER